MQPSKEIMDKIEDTKRGCIEANWKLVFAYQNFVEKAIKGANDEEKKRLLNLLEECIK